MDNPHYRFIREHQLLKEQNRSLGIAFARQKEIVRKANWAARAERAEYDLLVADLHAALADALNAVKEARRTANILYMHEGDFPSRKEGCVACDLCFGCKPCGYCGCIPEKKV